MTMPHDPEVLADIKETEERPAEENSLLKEALERCLQVMEKVPGPNLENDSLENVIAWENAWDNALELLRVALGKIEDET